MYNSVAKKIFAVGSAAAIALSALAPFAAQAAAHAAGTNVKSSDGTVWMIMPDGTRRAYTSGGAFLSFGFNSFANVVDANADDLALSAGAFIPPQDGQIMCSDRGADKGTCYLITGSQKAGFTSAAVFTGRGFSFSRALYGDVSFLSSTSNIDDTTMANRSGVLVNNNGTVYLVGASGLLGIPDVATFNSWGYSFADVVPANAADKAMSMTGVMAARTPGQLNPTALTGDPNQPPVYSGSVNAMLASDSPASSTIVASSSAVTLAKFNFTGSGTVTQLTAKRIGVSADTVLSNVYLYDGSMRLTDAASVGGNSTLTFSNPNGLFTVSGSKTISVVSEIAGNASSGQTVGVQLTGFAVANGTPASTSISGNLHTVSSVSDLATVSFDDVSPTGGSLEPASDVEIFKSSVSIGTRDVRLSRLSVRQVGSVNISDIRNFRLLIDGTQVAQVQNLTSDGYANFSFSPVTLQSGTRIFRILADVVGGSSRTFQFQIRNKVDVDFTDSNYGVVIGATSTDSDNAFPISPAAATSLSEGSLTFQKTTDSPSSDVTTNSNNQKLAKYTVTAYGEAMKIETLTISATSSDPAVGSLRNGRVLINGVQYGSTSNLVSNYPNSGTSYTLNYTVQPGTPITLEVYADIFDNDGTNNLGSGDTLTAYILAGSSNVQRMVSLGYTGLPGAAISGNSISVTTGSMTLAKNNTYAAQTTPLPQTNYKLGSYNLTGGSSEDVNVNTIDLAFTASTTLTQVNDVKVLVNGVMFGTVKSSITIGASATSSFSGNITLPKNTTVSVEVWGSIPTPTVAYSSDTITSRMTVNGTTVNSSTSVSSHVGAGQVISVGVASISAAQDPSTPVAAITAGNQTKSVAAFKFTTTNDQFTIKELVFSIGAVTTVNTITLKESGVAIATMAGSASTTFSGLNINVPANTTKVLTVELSLGTVGIGSGTTGENVKVTLHSHKTAALSSGTQNTVVSGASGNNLYVYKAIPTITMAESSGSLSAGSLRTISRFTISSSGSVVGWNHLVLDVASSAALTLASPTLWDADSNTQITASSSINIAQGKIIIDTSLEQEVSGTKTYEIKGTIGGTVVDAYITTSIPQPSSFVAPTTAATATSSGWNASFVWSDQAGSSGVAHTNSTSDWNNDFLVKNLPSTSYTLSN